MLFRSVLSWLYLGSAVLKRYEDSGRPAEDLPFVHWAMREALYRIQFAFNGFFANVPNRFAAMLLHAVIFPSGREFNAPGDALSHEVVRTMMTPGAARDRLTCGVFVPANTSPEIVTKLNAGLNEVLRQPDIQARLKTLNIDYRENTPDDFKSFVVTETEKWGKVVKDAGIKLG